MRMVAADFTTTFGMAPSCLAFSGGTPQIQSTPPVSSSATCVSVSLMVR